MMLKGANSNLIKDIKKKNQQIKKTLPEGVIVEPFLDRTKWSTILFRQLRKTYWKER
jgi:Cu/Ag efflux pump CusA